MQRQSLTMTGRPDEVLAAGVEANKKTLMQRNPKLTELEAHRQAIALALKENPTLLSTYRTYGRGQR